MFETSRRPHPLHTFRFWFAIVAAGAVTLAWKLDLLPFRVGPAETGRLAQEAFTDINADGDHAPAEPAADEPLPFSDGEMPQIVPSMTAPAPPAATTAGEFDLADIAAPAETLPQTAAGPARTFDDFDFAGQSEPLPTTTATTSHSTAANSPFAFDEEDWPSSGETPQSAATRPSMTDTAADLPSREGVVQTSATATVFETPPPAAMPTDANVPAEAATPPEASPGVDFTQIDTLLASGLPADEIDAHRQLSTLYWKQPEARDAMRERIDTLAQKIYFLNGRHYMDAYEVQPGDTLQEIARKYDITWQYLARLNRVDPRRVRAGQRLKVIKGPFSAIVDLSDFELTIHAHGYFVTRYPVGIGKDGSSPIGKFPVEDKLVDPTYFVPPEQGGGIVDADDPANPLGERWIAIGNGYGIHGTIAPASIGRSESHGCIRLHNDDVEAVYDLLTIGSEVVIRP